MLDNHFVPDGYGLISNFTFGNVKVSTYTFFVLLGLFVGIIWFYFSIPKKSENKKGSAYYIVMAALLGGLIGSKILVIIENIEKVIQKPEYLKLFIVSGKSIVGGIIGGYIGVRVIKKIKKIEKVRTGNQIAPAIALGMAIGRIGCFLTGCCYGIPTTLPIGVDFGDGIKRLPTQLIEIVFDLGLFAYLLYCQKKEKDLKPGILFKRLVLSYFCFRFFIEFIRGTIKNMLFLSIYQWICLIGFVVIFIQIKRSDKVRKENSNE